MLGKDDLGIPGREIVGFPRGIRGDCRSLLELAGVDRGRLEMMGDVAR